VENEVEDTPREEIKEQCLTIRETDEHKETSPK
jgi:hypothetical protein